jgi:hypothetical protein
MSTRKYIVSADEEPVRLFLQSTGGNRKVRYAEVHGRKDYQLEWELNDIKAGVYRLSMNTGISNT